MSYLERSKDQYVNIIKLIDKKISKGKGIKSLRKHLVKQIKHLEYLKSYE